MKVTQIRMAEVKDGKPFKKATWRKPTLKEQASVFSAMANVSNSRKVTA